MAFECLSTESSDSAVADRVFQLRQRIYVEEKHYPPEIVRDERDTRSRLLLLTLEGADVGTARLTDGNTGRLEFEEQHPAWAEKAALNRQRDEPFWEITRLTLIPSVRGGRALASMFHFSLKMVDWDTAHHVYGAGQLPGLTRLYQLFGFSVCVAAPVAYRMHGHEFGDYQLLGADRTQVRGIQASLRRKAGIADTE